MRLAILGTRGIPANYGGFETFAEQLARRLAQRGHNVTVYCRSHYTSASKREFEGVRLVVLPTLRYKYLDTVVHMFVSALHSLTQRLDVALVCNVANSMFVPIVKLSGTRVALNVDGLEWKRKKWSQFGKKFYQISERLACRVADALVSDAKVIQTYYRERYETASEFIPYGSLTEKARTDLVLRRLGLERRKYFLYVSRFEPENNAHVVLEAFSQLDTSLPLVMVGDAPYARDYVSRLKKMADARVLFTGYIFGQSYRELMSNALCYIHATEVGGTHPALVEAMGMGNGLLVGDTPENREVAGEGAMYFSLTKPEELAEKMKSVLEHPEKLATLAVTAFERATKCYDWERVTDTYETLLLSLKA